jgi:hypothetical protein
MINNLINKIGLSIFGIILILTFIFVYRVWKEDNRFKKHMK